MEQVKSEDISKLKALINERLTTENARQMYVALKPFDEEGFSLCKAAGDILQVDIDDVCKEFPVEDNTGLFEMADGFELLKWFEIVKFAENHTWGSLHLGEPLASYTIDKNTPQYREYREALWVAAVRKVVNELEKQPHLLPDFCKRLPQIEGILDGKQPNILPNQHSGRSR